MVGAVILLLIGVALRELKAANSDDRTRPDDVKTDISGHPTQTATPDREAPIQTQTTVHSAKIVAIIVALTVVVGVFSAISSETHEATLAEKLCAEANARLSEGVEQSVRDGASLFDRVFGTQTADRLPCADD